MQRILIVEDSPTMRALLVSALEDLDPELEQEGLARDVVRLIQQARRDADLHVSDRIELALELLSFFC